MSRANRKENKRTHHLSLQHFKNLLAISLSACDRTFQSLGIQIGKRATERFDSLNLLRIALYFVNWEALELIRNANMSESLMQFQICLMRIDHEMEFAEIYQQKP